MKYFFLFLFLFSFINTYAQKYSEAVEDNSFLVEEAYNQENRVVQHIFNFLSYPKPEKELSGSFTQEWPVFGQTSQFSYTIPLVGTSNANGLGDIMLNYRYQLTWNDDYITTAPRISLILPTGNKDKGYGYGKAGFQFNFPASKRLSEQFVAHANLGYTYIPKVKGPFADENITGFNFGASLIWLASYNVNFMLEYLYAGNSELQPLGGTEMIKENIINPGMRFAIDVGNLQIVPGFSVPIRIGKDITTAGAFLYLSLEHPF